MMETPNIGLKFLKNAFPTPEHLSNLKITIRILLESINPALASGDFEKACYVLSAAMKNKKGGQLLMIVLVLAGIESTMGNIIQLQEETAEGESSERRN